MSLSTLPLSYCTNVHPGRTLDDVLQGLQQYTAPVARAFGKPVAAGLWLAQPVIAELQRDPAGIDRLKQQLESSGLCCYTLNAFPYGDFHSERVKENVYRPDWSQPDRLEYTVACAQVLAQLMPEGTQGSISTVPLGFKQFEFPPDFEERAIRQLLDLARELDELYDQTGRLVRLAIEPEPLCLLETTVEAVAFFQKLWRRADDEDLGETARNTLGLCYDVCHQAVEFEDAAASIQALHAAGIRLNKIHITCAIRLESPAENDDARQALARYVEPRYLHQTFARTRDGQVLRQVDLSSDLASSPPDGFRMADEWRIHFHVPVDADRLGPLGTTRDDVRAALTAVAALEYAPHLEVETYTWEVLPGRDNPPLVEGLTRELTATRVLLDEVAKPRTAEKRDPRSSLPIVNG